MTQSKLMLGTSFTHYMTSQCHPRWKRKQMHIVCVLVNQAACAHSAEAEGSHLTMNSCIGSGPFLMIYWPYFMLNAILKPTYCKIPPNLSQQYVVLETWINLVINNFLHVGIWMQYSSRLNKVTGYPSDNIKEFYECILHQWSDNVI